MPEPAVALDPEDIIWNQIDHAGISARLLVVEAERRRETLRTIKANQKCLAVIFSAIEREMSEWPGDVFNQHCEWAREHSFSMDRDFLWAVLNQGIVPAIKQKQAEMLILFNELTAGIDVSNWINRTNKELYLKRLAAPGEGFTSEEKRLFIFFNPASDLSQRTELAAWLVSEWSREVDNHSRKMPFSTNAPVVAGSPDSESVRRALDKGDRELAVRLWKKKQLARQLNAADTHIFGQARQDKSDFYKWRRRAKNLSGNETHPDGSTADKRFRSVLLSN